MPRPRTRIAQLKTQAFRMSHLEAELVRYVGGTRGASHGLREMIRHYVTESGKFDLEAFAKHVRKNVLPEAKALEKRAIEHDLDLLMKPDAETGPAGMDISDAWDDSPAR